MDPGYGAHGTSVIITADQNWDIGFQPSTPERACIVPVCDFAVVNTPEHRKIRSVAKLAGDCRVFDVYQSRFRLDY